MNEQKDETNLLEIIDKAQDAGSINALETMKTAINSFIDDFIKAIKEDKE